MLSTHKTILPKKFAPKHTMSQGNAPHPPKGKLIYPHTINILHLSFHHSHHFLSSIQHAHTSLKSSKSNTYKTKRPLYSTWLYKGLFLRYLLYFLLYLALSFSLGRMRGVALEYPLFKLFFGFDFSYENSNFTFANRIILIRFLCVVYMVEFLVYPNCTHSISVHHSLKS